MERAARPRQSRTMPGRRQDVLDQGSWVARLSACRDEGLRPRRPCEAAQVRDEGDCAHVGNGQVELGGPGPVYGHAQGGAPGSVDMAGWDGEVAGASVRATTSVSPTSISSPRAAARGMRLWASTARHSQAPFALKLAEGQCSIPAPSFQSSMASSTVACWRWKASTSAAGSSRSVKKAK